VKIRGGMGEISIPIVELSFTDDQTSGTHLTAVHCAAAEHGGLITKNKKKESSWVKLKSFPT